jgi:curved DNA-binding protein CbpA
MSDLHDRQTYYELLEITPQAGPAEIYDAYRRAKTTYSPNSPAIYSMFTPKEAQDLMALIEEAYQTLSHQARRREYDLKMGLITAQPKPVPMAPPPPMVNPGFSRAKSENPWVGPVKVIPKKINDVPAGFARTKFSVYEVKDEVEAEIENIEECDGSFLQKIRLYRGVSLEQISDEIRVGKSSLVALEANDLDMLPVAVFTRGFVLQFARVLQLDERKIADAYMKYFRSKKP